MDGTSARQRLLDTASRLFYAEGVQSVGIDRILAESGVAKATLYKGFGSKEALVLAYLERRHENTTRRLTEALDRISDPVERLLTVFDVQAETFAEPSFNGCAFVAASVGAAPGSTIDAAAGRFRTWIRGMFHDLAVGVGAPQPDTLARQLHTIYDGASLAARMDHDPSVAADAKKAAEALLALG